MHSTKLAPYKPAQKPELHIPARVGASPNRPFLYRLPIAGERPMAISVSGLPRGLAHENGILAGMVDTPGEYEVAVCAENAFGSACGSIVLSIADGNICRTPLMGWTSWNTFAHTVSSEKILASAKLLCETRLADYGYGYINIDSSWQGEYGENGAITPCDRFPDMKKLCDAVHALGLKCGIYATPMLNAWGKEDGGMGLPGCTRGEPDPAFPPTMGGIGKEHHEKQNVRQWAAWGFDYLKYDWDPCDPINADLMKKELDASGRDFMFCVTVYAGHEYADYWSKNCHSWRDNPDSEDNFERVVRIFDTAKAWQKYISPGHVFDLDMLETGFIRGHASNLSEDEQIFAYAFRAFFASPLQLGCDLSKLTEFDMALYANPELIAIQQDALVRGAVCVWEKREQTENAPSRYAAVYERELVNGKAVAFFNPGATEETLTYPLNAKTTVRDVLARENLADADKEIAFTLKPHTLRILKLQNK